MVSRSRLRAACALSRPDHVLLILVVYFVGCIAGADLSEVPDAGEVIVVGLTLVLVAVSVHAANEYADFDTDALTVRTRFSGGSGALGRHGLPPAFAARVARVSGVAALAMLGAGSLWGRVPETVSLLLIVCLVAGWGYSVGPWPFSRHGWGEVVNALLGGLLLPSTGAAVAGAPLAAAFVTFAPFTLLVFVNLLETQWADRVADRAVGKHTLSARLTPASLRLLGGATAAAAYVLACLIQTPQVAAAGLVAAPVSAYGVWKLGRAAPGASVVAMVIFLLLQGGAWLT